MGDNDTIMDKITDAAATARDRVKDALSTMPEQVGDLSTGTRDDQARDNTTTSAATGEKDRTATSLSEDAHDAARAAEDKTNEAIDRVKEMGHNLSERTDQTYKDVKAAASDEGDKTRNAVDDTKATLAENMPGKDTQDGRATEETGVNKGFEVARDYAEKTEDALGPA